MPPTITLRNGHVLDELRKLPDDSIHSIITSPPYFGLRAYGTTPQIWGGDPTHEHVWQVQLSVIQQGSSNPTSIGRGKGQSTNRGNTSGGTKINSGFCVCGAWRGELGLEPTLSLYVEHMNEIFREIKRVLRPDGSFWLNIGDSYSGSGRGRMADGSHSVGSAKQETNRGSVIGLLPTIQHRLDDGQRTHGIATDDDGSSRTLPNYPSKSLYGIPYRLAFAMIDDSWILRSDVIWHKLAPMPESILDRPTRSHEHIMLFVKRNRYFYDHDAIAEPVSWPEGPWGGRKPRPGVDTHGSNQTASGAFGSGLRTRNARDVWTIAQEQTPDFHFATFPTALVAKCLKAGTSEYGVCAACGAPYRRVVEREPVPDNIRALFEVSRARTAEDHGRTDGFTTRKPNYIREVLGEHWERTCKCDTTEVVPATVLDPFVGSGTTCGVARALGRSSVGIELSEEYFQKTLRRLGLVHDAAVPQVDFAAELNSSQSPRESDALASFIEQFSQGE